MSYTTGISSKTRHADPPSGAPELIPGFSGIRVAQSFPLFDGS